MPVSGRRRPALALVTLVIVLLGACSPLAVASPTRVVGPRQWTQAVELVSGTQSVVAVRDTSGVVDDVEIDPQGVTAAEAVVNPPGQPGTLLVSWGGGACDVRADVGIAADGPGLAVTIATTVAPGTCDSIRVEHVLRLTLSTPVSANAVTVTTKP